MSSRAPRSVDLLFYPVVRLWPYHTCTASFVQCCLFNMFKGMDPQISNLISLFGFWGWALIGRAQSIENWFSIKLQAFIMFIMCLWHLILLVAVLTHGSMCLTASRVMLSLFLTQCDASYHTWHFSQFRIPVLMVLYMSGITWLMSGVYTSFCKDPTVTVP